MSLNEDLSMMAGLLADQTRTAMLIALMEGKALTAGELALRANISPQTASNHLKKMLDARLLICEPLGRHRCYKISSSHVAGILESLGVLTSFAAKRPPRHEKLDKTICFARTCYDHLAGELGVRIKNALIKKQFIVFNESQKVFTVTEAGKQFFQTLNISVEELMHQPRACVKPCLDWTEREYHVAGSLGTALLHYLLENRLILRSKTKARVVVLTTKGELWLKEKLGI